MTKRITFSIIISLVLLSSAALAAGKSGAGEDRPDCEIDKGPCRKNGDNMTITLDITPKPIKAMEELVFTVALNPPISPLENINLDLGMPGMYMGKNSVILKKDGTGKYSGKGIIPRCPSGRRLWRAMVEIPTVGSGQETGKTERVDFLFNVSY